MLVLSRKSGQRIIIGEDITLTVVGVEGSRVTLGIEAPRHQRILRGELSEHADEPFIIEITTDREPTTPPSQERFPLP
jgi:carbon storage regulator